MAFQRFLASPPLDIPIAHDNHVIDVFNVVLASFIHLDTWVGMFLVDSRFKLLVTRNLR